MIKVKICLMVKFFCFNPAMLDTKEGFPTIHMHLLWLVVSINLQRLTYWWGQLDNSESNLEKSILGTLYKGAPSLEIAPQINAQKQDTHTHTHSSLIPKSETQVNWVSSSIIQPLFLNYYSKFNLTIQANFFLNKEFRTTHELFLTFLEPKILK